MSDTATMKNLTDKRRNLRVWLGKVFFESFLVMFSILGALAISNWQNERSQRESVYRSMVTIQQEILQIQQWTEESEPYHQGLQTVVMNMSLDERAVSGDEIRQILDGLRPFVAKKSAWETMVDTGVLHIVDFELVNALSLAYGLQGRFDELYNDGLRDLIKDSFVHHDNSDALLYSALHFFNDVGETEQELLAVNAQVIEMLEIYIVKYQ